jgi:hypothetical protein
MVKNIGMAMKVIKTYPKSTATTINAPLYLDA